MKEMKVMMQGISRTIFLLLLLGSGHAAVAACVNTIAASTPTADFIDHGNGTVTHSKTGLMWKQCAEGLSGVNCATLTGTATRYTWQAALQAAETLNAAGGFAGYTDWRVPNIKELTSIVEEQCSLPAVNTTVFPNTSSSWYYWSASPYAGNASYAWSIFLENGLDRAYFKSLTVYVRLVRGGQ